LRPGADVPDKSAHGTKRRFATEQKFGSYREDSGHSAGSGVPEPGQYEYFSS